ncbi:MAG: glycosyl hydrolase family 18 protein [Elusimicrobiota bacterium]
MKRPPSLHLSAWGVYWDKYLQNHIETQGQELKQIDLFLLHLDEKGDVVPAHSNFNELSSMIYELKQKYPLKHFYITIVNDVITTPPKLKDPEIIHHILSNENRRNNHINQLLKFSELGDGIEIDYERVWVKDRELFTGFIKDLSVSLHARKKKLSVVVQPKTKDELTNGAGAMDWQELGRYADQIKIMAYHFHYPGGPSGPVAPLYWVKEIGTLALSQIPQEKIWMAFTLSGFEWEEGAKGKSLDYSQAQEKIVYKNIKLERDEDLIPHYSEQGSKGITEGWFEDSISIQKKITTLQEMGINQISYWRMGTGDSKIWEAHHE